MQNPATKQERLQIKLLQTRDVAKWQKVTNNNTQSQRQSLAGLATLKNKTKLPRKK
jgi:hypothetical protein